MAGTSAVFLREDYDGPSPVERDGMVWQAQELHLNEVPAALNPLDAMANVLALEGLEDYDPATHGDLRLVSSIGEHFVYLEPIRGWVQLEDAPA
ncbi:hypothetical protein NOR53_2139 [gamma proteobacterium NOR5-3]|jgi:hypothetical protein|nr:hypothetical protein NOR53_2139 [gamma proteobacterium NOR5-3]